MYVRKTALLMLRLLENPDTASQVIKLHTELVRGGSVAKIRQRQYNNYNDGSIPANIR